MNICLIFPPPPSFNRPFEERYTYPPLGILYIASHLEKAGYKATVIDCYMENIDAFDLKQRIKILSPDVVGISMNTEQRYAGLKCAEIVKGISKKILVVIGGVDPTFLDEEILKRCPYVDVVVRGEGEKTFLELLRKNKKEDIAGITYREGDRIIRNPDSSPIEDIDSLSFPAFHLIPMKNYFDRLQKYSPCLRHPGSIIVASRGCTSNCIFCAAALFWKRLRSHSPEYVTESMQFLRKNWGVKELGFYDSIVPTSKIWLKKFHDIIERKKINMHYRCFMKISDVDRERVELMRLTGCYSISIGVESGSQKISNIIGKGCKIHDVKSKFDLIHKKGIRITGYFMINLPKETKKDMYETLELAQTLPLTFPGVNVAVLDPCTRLSRLANIKPEKWFSDRKRPIYPSRVFTEKELYYICNYMRYRLAYSNFWRTLFFYIRIHPRRHFIKFSKSLIKSLMKKPYSIKENPFKEFEKEPLLLNVLDIILTFFDRTILLLKRIKQKILKIYRSA